MAETTAERITQLESIVNELKARVAADPANTDLPPLLAAAEAELKDLQDPPAATPEAAASASAPAAAATPPQASAAPAAAPAPAASSTSAPAAAPTLAVKSRPKIVAPAAPAARPAAKVAAPGTPAKIAATLHLGTRPNPAPPRPILTGVPTRNANKR